MRLKNMVLGGTTVAAAAVFLLVGPVDWTARAAPLRIRPSSSAVLVRLILGLHVMPQTGPAKTRLASHPTSEHRQRGMYGDASGIEGLVVLVYLLG
jgi:hypothetical protein